MDEFQAIGGCGIVMDVHTGEVLAMVSLPDYDANDFGTRRADDRFNRAVTGMYEPGSTFKLQTASMALDYGIVHIWDEFDASHPIHIGRFTITDFEGKHRWLYLPEVLAYSSNLGAAHIARDRRRASASAPGCRSMGMFGRVGIELPEAGRADRPAGSRLEGGRHADRRRSATASRSRRCTWCAAPPRSPRRHAAAARPSSPLPPGDARRMACR